MLLFAQVLSVTVLKTLLARVKVDAHGVILRLAGHKTRFVTILCSLNNNAT